MNHIEEKLAQARLDNLRSKKSFKIGYEDEFEIFSYSHFSDFDAAFERLKGPLFFGIEQSQQALVNLFEGLIKPAAQYHIFVDDPQEKADSVYIEQEPEQNVAKPE